MSGWLIVGLEMWWSANPQLHHWPLFVRLSARRYDVVMNDVVLNDAVVGLVPRNSATLYVLVLPGFAAITLAAAMWQKRKGRRQQLQKLQKLQQ